MPVRFKPGGMEQTFGPLSMVEGHTSTCAHCQHISSFPSMRKMQEHVDICRSCMKLVCLACAGKPCLPYEKFMEAQEKEQRRADMFRMLKI